MGLRYRYAHASRNTAAAIDNLSLNTCFVLGGWGKPRKQMTLLGDYLKAVGMREAQAAAVAEALWQPSEFLPA